jgi:tetratricopeptide (TPR) repeat protein
MPILSAENYFRRGLLALAENNAAEAAVHFESAIRVEREHNVVRPQMRYISYLGLALAQAHRAPEAIQACEMAARGEPYNPDLLLNLGRVHLMTGRLTLALATLERGRRLAPWHKGMAIELAKVDRRKPPPLRFLSRDHPLNKVLGKWRASLLSRTPRRLFGGGAPETS